MPINCLVSVEEMSYDSKIMNGGKRRISMNIDVKIWFNLLKVGDRILITLKILDNQYSDKINLFI